ILNITPTETVATPTFNPESGTFTEAQNVSISCATSGATIHYTTDGTTPTASSAVYSTPISVAETMTIKALAVKEGMINSEIAEATYTIQSATSYVFNKIYSHNAVTATDTYMIVDVNSGKALTSANGSSSAPTAVEVAINNDQITSSNENLFWKFEAVEGGYVIHPASGNDTWLYSTTSNNGVRVGTNDNKVWTLDITDEGQSDYHGFKNNATSRYMGVFNNQDWRTYTSIHANIKSTQIEIFVLGEAPTPVLNPELTVSATQLEGFTYEQGAGPSEAQNFVVSGNNLTSDIVITAPENFEIAISGDTTYLTTINLPFGEGTVASTTIHVRLAAGLLRNTYSGNLTVATTGTETQNIALSGSVTMSNAVATPTFSPAAGTFISTQSVSILCETEGATIYYTTNGETPTTESSVYTTPITVSATTTI
ncbi:MAG: chitobiase/beta-hexosaminidase C-terminal domain-containing protein, partial [Bacteroidales bacterium]|nr:chitobiase/beta-hexosaminidase C-terminal domain-containing protein [Bacteroidales bacterium]